MIAEKLTLRDVMWLILPSVVLSWTVGGLCYKVRKQGKLIDTVLRSHEM